MRATALILPLVSALALAGCASPREKAQTTADTPPPTRHAKPARSPTIGGAVLDAQDTIAANVAKAPNLTTLVGALKAAGLDATLAGPGPYTLLAPTNDAFDRLAPGTVDALLKPENKASLVKLLDYVVIAGRVTISDLRDRITAGGGTATLKTIEGDPITATLTGAVVTLTDVNGNHSYIESGDVPEANGLIHVVNGVLIPNLG